MHFISIQHFNCNQLIVLIFNSVIINVLIIIFFFIAD